MKVLVCMFVLLYLSVVCAWPWSKEPECGFDREDALECIKHFVDVNPKDDIITVEELEAAKTKYMTKAQKAGAWVASWFTDAYSVERIQKDCDFDKDGIFTPEDFRKATKHCLPDKAALCTLKGACDRAKEQEEAENDH